MRQDIIAELHTPDRLREALDVVEIVLGFLSSGGGKADKHLGEYIDKTLKMKKRRFSQKVRIISYNIVINYYYFIFRLRVFVS